MSLVHSLAISRRSLLAAGAGAAGLSLFARVSFADDAETAKQFEEIVGKAVEYLRVKGQATDGSFSNKAGIGPTVLVTTALLRHGRSPDDPMVAKALKYLEENIRDDGGIYSKGSRFRNYETCVGVMCFAEANKDGKYKEVLAKADKFLQGLQYSEAKGVESSDYNYGGGGYDGEGRPDLSNTGFMVDALKAAGNGADSQAISVH